MQSLKKNKQNKTVSKRMTEAEHLEKIKEEFNREVADKTANW